MTLCRPCQVAASRGSAPQARGGAPQVRGGIPRGVALGSVPRKRSQSHIVMRWIGIVLFITVMLGLKALSVGVSLGFVSLGPPTKDKIEMAKETVSGYDIPYTAYREKYPEEDDEEEGAGEGPAPAETWAPPVWVKEKQTSSIETLIICYDLENKLYDYSRYSMVDSDDESLFSAGEEEEHEYSLDWEAEPEKGWKHRGHLLVSCEFDGKPYAFHVEYDRKDRKNPKPIVTGVDANGKAILALAGKEIKWKPIEREANPHDPQYLDVQPGEQPLGSGGDVPGGETTNDATSPAMDGTGN